MTKRTKRRHVISFILMGCAVIQTSLMGDLHGQGKPEALDEQNALVQDMGQKLICYTTNFIFSVQEYVTPMKEMLQAQMDEAPLEQAKKLIAQIQESFESVQAKLTHENALGGLIAGLQAKLNVSVPQLNACLTESEQILCSLSRLEEQNHGLGKVQIARIGLMQEHIKQAHKHLEDEKKLVPIKKVVESICEMDNLIKDKNPLVKKIKIAKTSAQEAIKLALENPLCEKNMRDLCEHIDGVQKSFQRKIDRTFVPNAEENVVQLWKDWVATGKTKGSDLVSQCQLKHGQSSVEMLIVAMLQSKQSKTETVEQQTNTWGRVMSPLAERTGVSEKVLWKYITGDSTEKLLKRISGESTEDTSALDSVVWRSSIKRRETYSVAGNNYVSKLAIPEDKLCQSTWSMTLGRKKRGSMFPDTGGQADERASKRGSLRRSLSLGFKQVMSPVLSRKKSTAQNL